MGKKAEIPQNLREKIIQLHKNKLSNRKIATQLMTGRTTVDYIVKKYKTCGTITNQARSGRPRKTSAHTDRFIKRLALKNRCSSASAIAAEVKDTTGVEVHAQTIRNRLHENGLRGRVARKKPFISLKNKKKRLKFAKEYSGKPMEFWKSILWSDESKFNLFGSDGKTYVLAQTWRRISSRVSTAYS